MATIVGVALEATVVRAVFQKNGRSAFVEQPWDSLSPERAVDLLRAEIQNAQAIVLSVGLGFLEIATPELPDMDGDTRRRVLMRDADRYFPIEGSLAIAGSQSGAPAYATHSEQLQRWVRAFEEWAPVRAVVAAPEAIASVITTSGLFIVDAGAGERGLLQLANGKVVDARRVPAHAASTVANADSSLLLTGTALAPGKYSAAVGALRFVEAPLEAMLLDTPLEETLRATRTRRRLISYAVAALALVAIGFSANSRRAATLRATQHAVDSLQVLAAPGLAAKTRLTQLNVEANILAARVHAANDPLHVLATLSESLPRDAFVQRLEWDGKEWRLDGSVNQAASLVPRLDSARIFTNVRVLGASTRFRDGARMRESFSVAFQVKGDAVAGR